MCAACMLLLSWSARDAPSISHSKRKQKACANNISETVLSIITCLIHRPGSAVHSLGPPMGQALFGKPPLQGRNARVLTLGLLCRTFHCQILQSARRCNWQICCIHGSQRSCFHSGRGSCRGKVCIVYPVILGSGMMAQAELYWTLIPSISPTSKDLRTCDFE